MNLQKNECQPILNYNKMITTRLHCVWEEENDMNNAQVVSYPLGRNLLQERYDGLWVICNVSAGYEQYTASTWTVEEGKLRSHHIRACI